MVGLPFLAPVRVTQEFGENPSKYETFGLAGHNGIDFALADGERIIACADGEVVESAYDPAGYGFYVKQRTPDGEDILYAHLHPWELPHPGTWVAQGGTLGYADSSGNSTGTHLHLGYRAAHQLRGWPYNGYVDPRNLLLDSLPLPE